MKNLLLILLIVTIGAVLVLVWDSPPEFFFSNQKTQVQTLPRADSYMRDTTTMKYSPQGFAAYRLEAESSLYFSREDRFEFTAPELTAVRDGGDRSPWHLTALTANTSKGGEQVILDGEVHAWQQVKSGRNEMTTTRLTFNPQRNLAQTDAKVELRTPSGQTTGVGLKADFEAGIYQLLSQVRGTHYVQ